MTATPIFYLDAVMDGVIPVDQRVHRSGPYATYDEALEAGDVDGIEAFTIDKVFIPSHLVAEPEPAKKTPAKKTTAKR